MRHFVHAGTPILRIVNQNHRSQFDEGEQRATLHARTHFDNSFNGKVNEHSRSPWEQKNTWRREDSNTRPYACTCKMRSKRATNCATSPLQSRSEFDNLYIKGLVVKIDLFRYPTGFPALSNIGTTKFLLPRSSHRHPLKELSLQVSRRFLIQRAYALAI